MAMDYFFGYQENTFNLENNKCICQVNFFIYQITGSTFSTYLLFSSYLYLKDICKTLKGVKGIGKNQFVSKLTNLLNLLISKFHGSLHKKKDEIIKAWILLLMWKS